MLIRTEIKRSLIKLIDRLHNIQTIESMGAEKMQKIIYETLVNFITSSITLESLEIEQQLVESCVRYKYGQGHKPKLSSIKSLFPFSNNSSYLPDLFS